MIGRTAVVSTLAALGLAESAAAGSSREQLRAACVSASSLSTLPETAAPGHARPLTVR